MKEFSFSPFILSWFKDTKGITFLGMMIIDGKKRENRSFLSITRSPDVLSFHFFYCLNWNYYFKGNS